MLIVKDLTLSQILPMLDEETGAEPRIVSASISDPYLLLVRDDSSIFVARIDANNELEEIERDDGGLLSNKWLTGCLYCDTRGVFAQVRNDKGTKMHESIFMFLVNAAGALHVSLVTWSQGFAAKFIRYMRFPTSQILFMLPSDCLISRPFLKLKMLLRKELKRIP
jgi:hypothetical protein